MTRRTKITSLIVVVLLVIATIVLIRMRLEAFVSPSIPSKMATAGLYVTIFENNQPSVGQVIIAGDCPTPVVSSQNGAFTCELRSRKQTLQVTGLLFQSYAFSRTYNIPLSKENGFANELVIRTGSVISYRVEIDKSGNLNSVIKLADGQRTTIK